MMPSCASSAHNGSIDIATMKVQAFSRAWRYRVSVCHASSTISKVALEQTNRLHTAEICRPRSTSGHGSTVQHLIDASDLPHSAIQNLSNTFYIYNITTQSWNQNIYSIPYSTFTCIVTSLAHLRIILTDQREWEQSSGLAALGRRF